MLKKDKSPRQPLIRALEPRILFDGAAVGVAADAATDQSFSGQSSDATPPANNDTPPAARSPISRALDAARAAAESSKAENQRSAFFIDSGVEDHEALVDAAMGIADADVYMIDAAEDGFARIAETVQGGDYGSVHILGHGDSGQITLGASSLGSENMEQHADSLNSIGDALGPDGDLLLYGCDVAEGPAGRAFVDELSEAAGGIDVAASNDATGSAEFGGDWILEVTSGDIEAASLSAQTFGGLLAPPEVIVPEDALSASEDTDLIINDVSVDDADGDNLDVTLDVSSGTITLAQTTNLTVSGDGTGSVSVSGSAADINNALTGLTYRADSDFNGSDTLTISADDGQSTTSENVGIEVASVNDAPTLSPGNPTADEGGTTTLTEADFGITDPDLDPGNANPQLAKQIVFRLDGSTLPSEGVLQLDGNTLLSGSTFSLQDVRDGRLAYSHSGSQVSPGDTDAFSVTVNDGGGSGDVGPTDIVVGLQPVNDAPSIGGSPEVFEGQGTEAEFGNPGTVMDSADIGGSLSITDPDDAIADSMVTITNIDNAGEGTLFRDANDNGKLDAGEALTGGETFAASELAAGRLRFAHDGDEVDATNPSFDIEVTDAGGGAGGANAESSGPQTIDIQVKPNNDDPELANNSPVTVVAGGDDVIPITSGELNATDIDTAANRVVYTVTDIPALGELRLDGQILGVGGRFTQADINAGRVDYRQTDSFSDGDTDTFDFEVRDSTQKAFNEPGKDGAVRNPDGSIKTNTFTINFSGDESGGTGPGAPDPSLVGPVVVGSETVNGLTGDDGTAVEENDGLAGGDDTRIITDSELAFELRTAGGGGNSIAVPAEETIYRLTQLPGNGTLQLDGTDLGLFDTFTQQDINDGKLSFFHDGSENHQDSFGFSVSAGTNDTFDRTFALEAIPTNDAPMVNANDLPLLPEGGTTRITDAQIALNDVDVDNETGENGDVNDPNEEAVADDLMFRITDLPTNGLLERFNGSDWVSVTTDDLLSADLLTATADGGAGGLRYTHDGTENFADSFSVEVRDDLTSPGTFGSLSESGQGSASVGNVSGIETLNITVAPQNDAPILPQDESGADTTITDENGDEQTTANNPLSVAEGGTGVIDDTLLRAVDPDNTDPEVLQYRLTQAPENGFLTLNGSRLGVGSTFTQADINNGSLSYEQDGSESSADQFKFEISDSVNSHVYSEGGTGGESTFNINVDSARNDAPEIDNNGDGIIDLFGTFTHNFGNSLTIADADVDDGNVDAAAGETDFIQATIALTDSDGTALNLSASGGITLGSTSGLTLVDGDDSDGSLIIQGTFADVQAALTNLEIELANQDYNDTVSLDVTIDDRSRDASGNLTGGANGGTENEDGTPINEANNTSSVTVDFRASDDNDDPTETASPGNKKVNEDTVLDLSGYQFEDVDAFGEDVTVTVSVNNGHLSVDGNASTSDPAELVLTGSIAEINSQLDNLTYIANENFHSRDGSTSDLADDDTVSITINDGGNSGSGGGTDIAGTSTSIAINPVNDAPDVGVPGTQTLDSGNSVTFSVANGNAITLADDLDADNAPFNDNQRVTVSVQPGEGTLTASGSTGLTDQDGSGEVLVLEGTLSELNDALDGLVFTPADPNADRVVTITVELNDLANGGTQLADGVGAAETTTETVDVQISGVNEGPTVVAPVQQDVDEDASLSFNSGEGNNFTVSDPDDFGADMIATVDVQHGTVSAATGSGASLSGNDTATLTITGSEAEINAALDGLIYTPDADFHGSDQISVTLNDDGNTGTGGAKEDTQTADITVNPINDQPDAAGGPVTVNVTDEDQTGAGQMLSSLLGSNYSDATDDQTAITDGGDSSTALSFIAITGSNNYDPAQGTWQVSDGAGGWIDVPATGLDADNALVIDAGREIRFDPAPDFHGTPGTLDVRLADGDSIDAITESTGAGDLKDLSSEGGTGETGRWSADTVTIQTSVDPVNDRPESDDAQLAPIDEGNLAPSGETIGNLFGGVFDDATDDQSAIPGGGNSSTALGGIAIVGNDATAAQGTWQYSSDGGANWNDISTSVSDSDAVTLANDADTRLRFVPVDGDYNSDISLPGGLDVRLADTAQVEATGQDLSGDLGNDSTWSTVSELSTDVNPVNDAPSATSSQNFTVGEDDGTQTVVGFMESLEQGGGSDEDVQTITFNVSNISDGATYTAAELFDSLPAFTVATDGNNTLSFTPSDILAAGESETVTLTVGVTDNGGTANGGSDTGSDQTFTITINGANDAPTATDDVDTTDQNTVVSRDAPNGLVDPNDTDPDGSDVLTVDQVDGVPGNVGSAVTGSNGGQFTLNPDGSYDFDPNGEFDDLAAGESRTTSVTYRASDGNGGTDTATLEVTVNGQNDSPVTTGLGDQSADDGETVSLDTSTAFSDADTNDTLTYSATDLPPGLSIDPATGEITGTIDFNASQGGPYNVTVTVDDGNGGTEDATFTWTVSNPPPVAADDTNSSTENAPVSGDVLANDNDTGPDGDDLTVDQVDGVPGNVGSAVTGSNGGQFTLNPDGSYDFDPNGEFDDLAAGESRTTSVTYRASDGNGGTDTATLEVTVNGQNDSPVTTGLGDQSADDGETVSLDTSTAFSDADTNDTLTYSATDLPPGLSIDPATGEITGTIDFNASQGGPYNVTVTVDDGNGGTEDATFTWTVSNPPPVAADDTNSSTENAPVSGDVLANDNDTGPDGDDLTVDQVDGVPGNVGSAVTGSNGGQFTLNPDGSYDFDPNGEFDDLAAGESRTTSVTYRVSDGNGGTDTATLEVTVNGQNDSPVTTGLGDQSADDGETVSLDTSTAFSDADTNDTLTYSATDLPPGLSIDPATGEITGTIDFNASQGGPYNVTVTVDDGNGGTEDATFTWTVSNPPPVAADDTNSSTENAPVSGDVLANDNDTGPDGDDLTVDQVDGVPGNVGSAVTGSNGGQFTLNPDGSYDFDPNGEFDDLAAGESRTTSVTYRASDGNGGTDTATLEVTVNGQNDSPVTTGLGDQSADDGETVSLDTSTAFSDADTNDTLTYSATDLPPGLSIDPATGEITGTIDFNASQGGPYNVTVTVDDGNGGTEDATFTWTVNNPAPVAVDDTDATDEETAISRDATNGVLIPNDSDGAPDGDDLTLDQVEGSGANVGAVVSGSNGGQFTVNADGSYDFDPNGDFNDLAAGETRSTSITYRISDGNGGTDTATLEVTVNGQNDSPVTTGLGDQSADDGETVALDTSTAFSDPDTNDTLTYSATDLPPGLSIDPATGEITGTIDFDASQGGPYNVTVTVDDGNGGTEDATFTWTVNNPVPVAVDDTDATDEETAISRDATNGVLIPNDSDGAPDGDDLTLDQVEGSGANVGAVVSGSNGGQFTVNADGSYDFDPNGDFNDLAAGETRSTSITYRISDGNGGTDTATLEVTVNGQNDSPVTTGLGDQSADDGETVSLDTSTAFSDADTNDTLTYSATDLPPGLSIDPATGEITGTIDFNASQGGPYNVTVTVDDGNGGTEDATFTWTVSNPPPVAADDTNSSTENAPVSGDVLANDNDTGPDGDDLTVDQVDGVPGNVGSAVTGSNGGQFTLNPDGSYDFDPNGEFDDLAAGESRTTSVTYRVSDGNGGTDTATLEVTVNGQNDAPTAIDIPDDRTPFGADYTNNVSGSFDDIDEGDELTYSAEGLPEGLSIDPETGEISGRPLESGAFGVTITATDLTGETVSEPFELSVTPPASIPDAPVVPGDSGGEPPAGGDDVFISITETPPAAGVISDTGLETGAGPMLFRDALDTGLSPFTDGTDQIVGQLRYQATQADGSPLPEGLTVDPDTGEIKGQLPPGTDRAQIRVIGVDQDGNTLTREVIIDQQGNVVDPQSQRLPDAGSGYHRMEVSVGIDGQVTVNSGQESGIGLIAESMEVAARRIDITIADTNAAEVTRYVGRLSDGEPLPQGLTVDPATGQITGTVPEGTEELSIQIIAEQSDGENRTLQIDLNLDRPAEANSGDWQPFEHQVRSALAATGDAYEAPHGHRMLAALGISH